MPYYISPPPQSPFIRFITGIVAVLAVAAAFMVGMVALLVVAGIGLLAGVVIWARVAWIKRKLRKSGFTFDAVQQAASRQDQSHQGQIIDAEYTVISEKKDPP